MLSDLATAAAAVWPWLLIAASLTGLGLILCEALKEDQQ